MTQDKKDQFDFATAMRELEEINQWFQNADIDLDVGLEKLKRGKELIVLCRKRLKSVETEFVKIREEYHSPDVVDTVPEADGALKTSSFDSTTGGSQPSEVPAGASSGKPMRGNTEPESKAASRYTDPDDDLPF